MVYDMFTFGGAYRKRTDEDCILLFKNAYEENLQDSYLHPLLEYLLGIPSQNIHKQH